MLKAKEFKILHLDKNHSKLLEELNNYGFNNELDYTSSREEILNKIHKYHGIVLRSRIQIDKEFLEKAYQLKFIARVGAGLENIDTAFAKLKNIELISSPEGNRNAVGEHALAMLLNLLNKTTKAHNEIKQGKWLREENRGYELDGKTVAIIGYGNTGKAFAKKLKGFNVEVLCNDILSNIADENAKQVSLQTIQEKADIISLHTPLTQLTNNFINKEFIKNVKKPFWFINTARGKCVVTKDIVWALKENKLLGVALDVIEYEKNSFENLQDAAQNQELDFILNSDNVVLTPHIAGWSFESNTKMAEIISNKVINFFEEKI